MRAGVYILVIGLILVGCKEEAVLDQPLPSRTYTDVPAGFPEIPFPEDNPFTIEKWELGKKLFYEKGLSVDYSISCGSCHVPAKAFTDGSSTSTGAHGATGTRNSPSLANVAYHPYYTREGGVPTLEMQVLVPVQEHNEFDFNILGIEDRFANDEVYQEMSQRAFGRPLDPYSITRALATFERTLISGNSAYDRYKNGESNALSERARRGMRLFFDDRTQCSTCHSGFNFTDYSFRNNGLYEDYSDPGRFRLTVNEADRALFKVASLRNVALTAPYMHDGSMATLTEVVEHYNLGGFAHPNKDQRIKPLGLTQEEMEDLVAFLEHLTDYEFISNKTYHED